MVLLYTLKKLHFVTYMQLQTKIHWSSINIAIRNIQNQDTNLFNFAILFTFSIYHILSINIFTHLSKKPFSTSTAQEKNHSSAFLFVFSNTLRLTDWSFGKLNWTTFEIRTNSTLKKIPFLEYLQNGFILPFVHSCSNSTKATYSNQEKNNRAVFARPHLYKFAACK